MCARTLSIKLQIQAQAHSPGAHLPQVLVTAVQDTFHMAIYTLGYLVHLFYMYLDTLSNSIRSNASRQCVPET
eukprot:4482331-Amphidinium_carterae.1